MSLKVTKVEVWHASLKDKPGALAKRLKALKAAGANLEFVVARRSDRRKARGVVFVTPVRPGRQARAAAAAGFERTPTLHSVRVEGPDRAGQGARLTAALADAGLNLRGLSAAAMGKRFIMHLAFDAAAEASKAVKLLKALA